MYTQNLTYILVTLGQFEFIDGSETLFLLKIPSIVTLQEWCSTQFWLFFDIYSHISKTFSNDDVIEYAVINGLDGSGGGVSQGLHNA